MRVQKKIEELLTSEPLKFDFEVYKTNIYRKFRNNMVVLYNNQNQIKY